MLFRIFLQNTFISLYNYNILLNNKFNLRRECVSMDLLRFFKDAIAIIKIFEQT
jgi:hypothetical protein